MPEERPRAPRHSTPSVPTRAARQQQARLARTAVVAVAVLAVGSAMTGYLLHDTTRRPGTASGPPVSTAVPLPGTAPVASSTAPPAANRGATGRAAKSVATQSVPNSGDGKFTPVTVPETTTARSGRVVTYALQVEGGMHADAAAAARDFGKALLDRRGWQGVDHVRFVQVTPAQLATGTTPAITVLLASPAEVVKLCAPLPTHGQTSCHNGKRVVLNYKLWMQGVTYFEGHLAEYREYMVNHEVGHALGHGHQKCPRAGAYAPVMQQQTLGLQGCKAWPWPKRPDSHGQG